MGARTVPRTGASLLKHARGERHVFAFLQTRFRLGLGWTYHFQSNRVVKTRGCEGEPTFINQQALEGTVVEAAAVSPTAIGTFLGDAAEDISKVQTKQREAESTRDGKKEVPTVEMREEVLRNHDAF